jgi:hypothetical protein
LKKGQQYFELAHEFVGSFESEGVPAKTGVGLVFTAAKKQTEDEQKEDKARQTNRNQCQCKRCTPGTRYTFTTNIHVVNCTHQTE